MGPTIRGKIISCSSSEAVSAQHKRPAGLNGHLSINRHAMILHTEYSQDWFRRRFWISSPVYGRRMTNARSAPITIGHEYSRDLRKSISFLKTQHFLNTIRSAKNPMCLERTWTAPNLSWDSEGVTLAWYDLRILTWDPTVRPGPIGLSSTEQRPEKDNMHTTPRKRQNEISEVITWTLHVYVREMYRKTCNTELLKQTYLLQKRLELIYFRMQ